MLLKMMMMMMMNIFGHLAFMCNVCKHQVSTPTLCNIICILIALPFPQMHYIALHNVHCLSIFLQERRGAYHQMHSVIIFFKIQVIVMR
jgi:hypothetical protein